MAPTLINPPSITPTTLGPLSVRILANSTALSFAQLTIPASTRGLPLLSNRLHAVTYYVLSGSVRFSSSQTPAGTQLQHYDAAKGEVICIPPGITYGFGNGSAEQAEVLCIYAPGEWVGAMKEQAGKARENWKGLLRSWGCVLPEEEEDMDDDSEDEEDDGELTHVPARLRCMAG